MPKQIRCRCGGNKACKLCNGAGKYDYEPGPLGWQPFTCPTCQGQRSIDDPMAAGGKSRCFTCGGAGSVDPANAGPLAGARLISTTGVILATATI